MGRRIPVGGPSRTGTDTRTRIARRASRASRRRLCRPRLRRLCAIGTLRSSARHPKWVLLVLVLLLVVLRMGIHIPKTREGMPTPTRKPRNCVSIIRMVRPVRLFVAYTLVVELLVSIATRGGRKERDRVVRDARPPPRPPLLRAQRLPQGIVVC